MNKSKINISMTNLSNTNIINDNKNKEKEKYFIIKTRIILKYDFIKKNLTRISI